MFNKKSNLQIVAPSLSNWQKSNNVQERGLSAHLFHIIFFNDGKYHDSPKISGLVSSTMVARYFLSRALGTVFRAEIQRANCPQQKSQTQTVPSRNPEGKLSRVEIQRANCPSRNREGKLSQAEILRANCPKRKSRGQTVPSGNPEGKLSQAEIQWWCHNLQSL